LPDSLHPWPGVAQTTRRTTSALRLALGALLALSLLSVPSLVRPATVAASSCTGWSSLSKPPRTIKVLRTATGKVDTVDFYKYVAVVMASGEWPTRLRTATLEVGAVAVKQYAWYYAMRGHHRDGYVSGGHCYDVRDDTNDQLFRPERVQPTDRQHRAIHKTWGLTLRKNGRFFLTGYRQGSNTSCAADTNGWKLYERSIDACAASGWSSARIMRAYLDPNLDFVWSGGLGPRVSRPKAALRVGNAISAGAVTVAWHPIPRDANVARFQLQRKIADGSWKNVSLAKVRKWSSDVWVKLGARNRFRVRAQDAKGVWGRWSYGRRRRADIRGPRDTLLATGDATVAATEPGKVHVRFTGRSVAVVARTGPGLGQIKIFVDGKRAGLVDLDRPVATERRLVWTRNWKKLTDHGISVKAVSSNEVVDFRGFFVLR
jgi:hypothetical protein